MAFVNCRRSFLISRLQKFFPHSLLLKKYHASQFQWQGDRLRAAALQWTACNLQKSKKLLGEFLHIQKITVSLLHPTNDFISGTLLNYNIVSHGPCLKNRLHITVKTTILALVDFGSQNVLLRSAHLSNIPSLRWPWFAQYKAPVNQG